jgi:hypothetical protein
LLSRPIKKSFTIASLFCLSCITHLHAQDASQLGFSDLQSQANALVERGQLEEAMPFLKELIKRVEATEDSEIKLDFPIFLLGTAHIQRFVGSGNGGELKEASNGTISWRRTIPTAPS